MSLLYFCLCNAGYHVIYFRRQGECKWTLVLADTITLFFYHWIACLCVNMFLKKCAGICKQLKVHAACIHFHNMVDWRLNSLLPSLVTRAAYYNWWLSQISDYSISVCLMSTLWVTDHSIKKWVLHRPCEVFCKKYDAIQEQIFLAWMISNLFSISTGRAVLPVYHLCKYKSIHLKISANIRRLCVQMSHLNQVVILIHSHNNKKQKFS